IGRRRNGVLVISKPRMAFVVALGIAAALLGVSAFSTPAAAANNVPISLYGSRAAGWGETNTTLTAPGPPLTVHVGDNVTLNLTSVDGVTHRWCIDYNNNSACGGSAPIAFFLCAHLGEQSTFCIPRNDRFCRSQLVRPMPLSPRKDRGPHRGGMRCPRFIHERLLRLCSRASCSLPSDSRFQRRRQRARP